MMWEKFLQNFSCKTRSEKTSHGRPRHRWGNTFKIYYREAGVNYVLDSFELGIIARFLTSRGLTVSTEERGFLEHCLHKSVDWFLRTARMTFEVIPVG